MYGVLSDTSNTDRAIGFYSFLRLVGTVYFKKHLTAFVASGIKTPEQLYYSCLPDTTNQAITWNCRSVSPLLALTNFVRASKGLTDRQFHVIERLGARHCKANNGHVIQLASFTVTRSTISQDGRRVSIALQETAAVVSLYFDNET